MKTYQSHLTIFLLLFCLGLRGQDSKPLNRQGLILGLSIGAGSHFYEGEAFARFSVPNVRIGYMINSKWAMLLHAPGGVYRKEGEDLAFEGIIPTAQYWFNEHWYVNAGVGVGIETTPFYLVDYEAGPPTFHTGMALFSSLGREVYQWGGNKTIDLQLRALYGSITKGPQDRQQHLAFDLVIGINLY